MNRQKALARQTKEYRIENGLTQLRLALLLGISEATVWRIERARSVSVTTAYKVRKFLENSR